MKPLIIFAIFLISFSDLNAQNAWSKEELLGKFDPKDHPDFEKVSTEFSSKPAMYLHRETYQAYRKMYYAAKKCGVDLNLISTTRSFAYQRGIWERKWRSDQYSKFPDKERCLEIMKYSAMPGASRHHWGTDVDLNDLNNSYFNAGKGKEVYEWLQTHAASFGFYQPYTSKEGGRTGYEEEKWHWTYLPLSQKLLQQYNGTISPADLNGFSGSKHSVELEVIKYFVNGVELPVLD